MPPPAVTVIIPTYNRSAVLAYAIRSVLWQTFTDFELLVVGDGCTDESEAVVRGVADSRVRWINLPANTGHQSGPNNEGLRQARGDVIAYLGHDDLWLPHHLECLLDGLASGADLAYGVTACVNTDGAEPEPAMPNGVYQAGMWMPPTGVIHRRWVTDRLGGWRDYRELRADPEADLWYRAFRGCPGGFVFILRLTAIKFPAGNRGGVYQQRPNHEQATWYERIRTTPHLEATELARMMVRAHAALEALSGPAAAGSRQWERGERVRANREFKGLDPDPGSILPR
jgi:glycosyltransferase involved in cell wall biosynthesis